MAKKTTFEQDLAQMHAMFKYRDTSRIAEKANTTPATVRKLFTRKSPMDMTEKETEVYNVCKAEFKDRVRKAIKETKEIKKLTNA